MWMYKLLLLMLWISMGNSQSKGNLDQRGKNYNSTSRGIPVYIGDWKNAQKQQNIQGGKWNSQTKVPPLGWFAGHGPGSAPIRRPRQTQNGTNSNQKTGSGQSGSRGNSGAPWNNQNRNSNQGYWYMNSGPYQYNGPPPNWNNGPGPNGPPGNWNTQGQNGPPSNWNNGPGQNRQSSNWNNGPGPNGPPGNWNTQGQKGPPSNRNNSPSQNGPPSNWNNGPSQNGPPSNRNNGPQNNRNTQGQSGPSGPPNNWNNFGPGNSGPGPNTNWNGPPGQNTNWNGPPGPPMGWNGPYGPNMNWYGPPGPNSWNGPPGGFGPNPAFMSHHMGQTPAGVGIALLDPDLPDGLDDRFQRMQAAQAMRQMGVDIGPPPPFVMPPVPLPVMQGQGQPPPWVQGQGQQMQQQNPIGSSRNSSTGRVGWPLRPSSRAGFWTGASQNNTKANSTNQNTTSTTTSNTSIVPTPTLAEFQHTSKNNSSFNTQRTPYNFNYPYGNWNSGVYNPIGYRNWQPFQRPDVPDHLEDRPPKKSTSPTDVGLPDASFGGKRFSSAAPKIPNLTSNMRNVERENIGRTLPKQRIQGLAKSSSIQIWPSRTPSPRRRDFYDQRIRNVERVLGKISRLGNMTRSQGQSDPRIILSRSSKRNRGGGVEREPEPEKKSDGDHETERETDKEEGVKNIDPRIVRRVLDVIKQQRGNDGVSLDSIMAGLNDQGYKFKMKYRYEGSVPAPAWVDRLGNIEAGPTASPASTQKTSPIKVNVTAPPASEVMMSPTQVIRQQVRPFQPRNLSHFNFGNKNSQIHSFPTFQSPSNSFSRNPNFQWRSPASQSGTSASRPVIGLLSPNAPGNKNAEQTTNIPHLADILRGVVQNVSKTTIRPRSTVSPSDFEVQVEKGPEGPVLNIEHDPVGSATSRTPIARNPNKFNLGSMVPASPKPATFANKQSVTTISSKVQKGEKNVSVEILSNNTAKLQQMEPIPAPEISASQTFGIIAGVIIGFTVILAPIICLICRFRDKRKQKQRKLSAKKESTSNKDDGGLMDAMIASELGVTGASKKGAMRQKHKWIGSKANNIEEDGEYSELQELKSNKQTTNVEIHC